MIQAEVVCRGDALRSTHDVVARGPSTFGSSRGSDVTLTFPQHQRKRNIAHTKPRHPRHGVVSALFEALLLQYAIHARRPTVLAPV